MLDDDDEGSSLVGAVVVPMRDAATAWEQDNSYVLSLQQTLH